MRKILFLLLLWTACMLQAQNVIDNPKFKFRSGSICNITRIERNPDATRLQIHVIFRPHWWVKYGKDVHLEDADTGKKYYLTGSEGLELDKEVYTPDSGTLDFVLLFPPLPRETQTIHFLEDDESSEHNTYYISLENKDAKSSVFEQISGNWMGTDDCYEWAFGVYDSLVIADNRFYSYENIRRKGKGMLLTLKDDEGKKLELELTPQKNGLCRIRKDKEPARLYARHTESMKAPRPDEHTTAPVFRRDSLLVQGYIAGYDRKLGFSNGLIYVSNDLTREDYPMVVNIRPDGRFECKLVINYPIFTSVVFNNTWIPFYAEPGQTVTLFLDWEAVMARSRARDYTYPLHNLHYMGSTAYISRALKCADEMNNYPYRELSKMQKELTPAQFAERHEPMFRRALERADSLVEANQYTGKAERLVRNAVKVAQGGFLFDFVMHRNYLARDNKDNPVLQVPETKDYYRFLRQMPLNDSLIVADKNFSTFINRMEYMNFARAVGDTTIVEIGVMTVTYPERSLLTYLKEKGVKLTPEEDKLRIAEEGRAGKVLKRQISELIAESEIWEKVHAKHKDLVEAYAKENKSPAILEEAVKSDDEMAKEEADRFYEEYRLKMGRLDTIAGYPTFIAQVIPLRGFKFAMEHSDRDAAAYVLEAEKKLISHPFMQSEAERLYAETFPQDSDTTYALPGGRATEIFRDIIKAHAGKVLFVDFWATTCGPCRGGIEHTADLREQYKDHPEFQFIYITSDRESPEKAYNEYVEKHLKGEACYRIPQSDYNFLRQLFRFNGIPHYELIEKDGTVSRNSPSTHDLKRFLQKRFGGE